MESNKKLVKFGPLTKVTGTDVDPP